MRVAPHSLPLFFFLVAMGWLETAGAIEVAPRISDREIIQELTTIKAGQDKINQRLDDSIQNTNKRFDDVNKRIDDVNKRIEESSQATNKRIEESNQATNKRIEESNQATNKRIDDINQSLGKRIDDLTSSVNDLRHTMLTLFGALLSLIMALIGFILWDRRTMMRPLEERIVQNAKEIKTIHELLQEKSSQLSQFLQVLREMAKDDPKLSTVLRNFSLL
ncbi:MAG: hypothetical protein HQL94_08240 [Magnetococcales bacterium]|nr:hypothetical protein [Magnetococcales bacterium]